MFDVDSYFLDNYAGDGKILGIYDGRMPTLLIADPEMIRAVLQKQSNEFYDRTSFVKDDPSLIHFSLDQVQGKQWKRIRQILTPAFTPAKLRGMVPLINECTEALINDLKEKTKDDACDIKEMASRFTLRAISSIGFGLDTKNSGVEAEFKQAVNDLFGVFNGPLLIFIGKRIFSQFGPSV